jgi:hypothetical protein
MALWLQHALVLLIVAACVVAVVGQGLRIFAGKRSKLGSCCAKGCDAAAERAKTQTGGRVVFFPSDMLTSSARRRCQ